MSLVVLISSITLGGECESSKSSNAKTQSEANATSKLTANFKTLQLQQEKANLTKISDEDAGKTIEGSHIRLPSDPPASSLNTTSSSISNDEEERIEESKSVSSTTVSPNTTTAFSTIANADDDANNSSIESTSPTTTHSPPLQSQEYCNSFFGRQHDFWKSNPGTYIILIQASSGTGIFVALLQLGFSWLLICGSGKVRFGTLYFMNHACL